MKNLVTHIRIDISTVKRRAIRNIIVSLPFVFILFVSGAWAEPATLQGNVSDPITQNQLKLEKSKAENLAVELMKTKKPNSTEYKEAKRLYTKAQEQYNAYTSTLLMMLKNGQKQDMSKVANDAASAASQFTDYVNSKIPDTKSAALIPVVAGVLFDLAERLWKIYSSESKAQRDALAAELEPKITWKSWSDLTREG